jgi:hypothetical protein
VTDVGQKEISKTEQAVGKVSDNGFLRNEKLTRFINQREFMNLWGMIDYPLCCVIVPVFG